MEEFVRAEVNSYDAIIDANGNPIFEAGNVSPMSIMDIVNDNDNSIYYIIKDLPEDTRAAGRAAVKSFGVKSRFIHFEFFRMTENQASMGKKGQIVALEVNMRPCGGFTPDMINFARSTNVYKIWADMIAFGGTDMPVGEHFYCPFAGRRDGKHFVYSHEQIMQKYQQNIRMVDRMPDALSGAMGNQMYVATFSTREGMEQFYSDVLAVTDDNNAAVQKELTNILALGEPETTPAEKPAAPAAKRHAPQRKVRIRSNSPGMACPFRGFRCPFLQSVLYCCQTFYWERGTSMKIPANGFTHAGKFHADDVFATALLQILRPDIKITRGFVVPDDFDGIVYDVGFGMFDHHQEPRECRPNGVPYAALGLLWRVLGPALWVSVRLGSLTRTSSSRWTSTITPASRTACAMPLAF